MSLMLSRFLRDSVVCLIKPQSRRDTEQDATQTVPGRGGERTMRETANETTAHHKTAARAVVALVQLLMAADGQHVREWSCFVGIQAATGFTYDQFQTAVVAPGIAAGLVSRLPEFGLAATPLAFTATVLLP